MKKLIILALLLSAVAPVGAGPNPTTFSNSDRMVTVYADGLVVIREGDTTLVVTTKKAWFLKGGQVIKFEAMLERGQREKVLRASLVRWGAECLLTVDHPQVKENARRALLRTPLDHYLY